MKVEYLDASLKEIAETGTTTNSKYKKLCRDKKLVDGYIRIVKLMDEVANVDKLREYSYLHYERLKHQNGESKCSVRLVNGKIERLLFYECEGGVVVELIEIDNTHYGNKK